MRLPPRFHIVWEGRAGHCVCVWDNKRDKCHLCVRECVSACEKINVCIVLSSPVLRQRAHVYSVCAQ